MRPERMFEISFAMSSLFIHFLNWVAVATLSTTWLMATDFRNFLDQHCVACHDDQGHEGGLDLIRFTDESSVMKDRRDWLRIYEKIESRQMPPPKGGAQPSEAERAQILRWIEEIASRPDQVLGAPDPGKPALRRLTRLEYNNSIRDLFGLDVDVFMFPERLPFVDKHYFRPWDGKLEHPLKISIREYGGKYNVLCPQLGLPGDNRADHGFRNRGDAMDFSPLHFEKYFAAAHEIVHCPDLAIRSSIAAELFGIAPTERQSMAAIGQRKQKTSKDDLEFAAVNSFAPKLQLLDASDSIGGEGLRAFRELIRSGFSQSIAGVFDAGDASAGAIIVPGKGGLLRIPFGSGKKKLTINPNVDLWIAGFGTADETSGGHLFCNHVKGEKEFELTLRIEDADEDEGIEQLAICVLGRRKESGAVTLKARFTDDTEAKVTVELLEGTQGTRVVRFFSAPGESIKSVLVDGSKFSGDYVLFDDLGFVTNGRPRPPKVEDLLVGPQSDHGRDVSAADRAARDRAGSESLMKDLSKTKRMPKERLSTFVARAFRREVTDVEVQPFLTIFETAVQQKDSETAAMKAAIVAVLTSPQFLFVEANGDFRDTMVAPLEDFELATRLALFLWASIPDDELLELARNGRLSEPAILEAQTRRMLRDPKSRELSESFATQWLRLDQLYMAKPDRDLFKSFYSGPQGKTTMHGTILTEALLLFETVHIEDRSILDFIAADYTWLNPALARHYGIDFSSAHLESGNGSDSLSASDRPIDSTRELRTREDAAGWRRVQLSDSMRGGFVTMAAPLVVTSLPFRTSPVKRGAWLLETIFNRPPTEPKVAFVVTNDTKEATQKESIRERFEAHRNQAACYSCHTRLDPPGFALERFDPIGRWREVDGGKDVDARGEWQGEAFDGPDEFKACLAKHPDDFARGFIEHMLSYALGRELQIYDMPTVATIQEKARVDGWRLSRVVVEIAKSYPFTHTRRE